jgi:hypothetical protein
MTEQAPNPLTDATAKPGKILLYRPGGAFCQGRAGAGRRRLCRLVCRRWRGAGQWRSAAGRQGGHCQVANWSPKDYELTWTPTDAMMGPSGDMGYTWGHFEGRSKDANGNPVLTSGRYITMWRKQPDGTWKVVLDAGANEPPAAGDCCKLPGH